MPLKRENCGKKLPVIYRYKRDVFLLPGTISRWSNHGLGRLPKRLLRAPTLLRSLAVTLSSSRQGNRCTNASIWYLALMNSALLGLVWNQRRQFTCSSDTFFILCTVRRGSDPHPLERKMNKAELVPAALKARSESTLSSTYISAPFLPFTFLLGSSGVHSIPSRVLGKAAGMLPKPDF